MTYFERQILLMIQTKVNSTVSSDARTALEALYRDIEQGLHLEAKTPPKPVGRTTLQIKAS